MIWYIQLLTAAGAVLCALGGTVWLATTTLRRRARKFAT